MITFRFAFLARHWAGDGTSGVLFDGRPPVCPYWGHYLISPWCNQYFFTCSISQPVGDILRACTVLLLTKLNPRIQHSFTNLAWPNIITIIAACWFFFFNPVLLPYLFGSTWHSAVSKNILFAPIYLFVCSLSIWNNEFHPPGTPTQMASNCYSLLFWCWNCPMLAGWRIFKLPSVSLHMPPSAVRALNLENSKMSGALSSCAHSAKPWNQPLLWGAWLPLVGNGIRALALGTRSAHCWGVWCCAL